MEIPEGYKQTEVGIIPENWDVQPVGEAFEIRNHLRLPISRSARGDMQGQYPYYGPTNIQDYINEYRVEGKHALIGEDGDHFLKWRDISMTLLVDGKFNVNNHAHIIRGVDNLTLWFYYFFAHKDLTPHLKRQGAGRFKLNKATLIKIPCAIPPLPEQRAIAATLSDVDALIAALDKLIAKQRHLKTATMQQLLTGKKRLPGFGEGKGYKQTEVGVIPEDWDVATLGDFTDKVGSGITPTGGSRVYKDSGRPFIRSQNVGWGFLQLEDLAYIDEDTHQSFAASEIREGDILLNITGASIGRSCLADGQIDTGNVNQHVCIIRTDQKRLNSRFLGLFILSEYGQRQIDSFQAGGNREGLNFGQIRSFQIRIPQTIEEQRAIATVLSDMDAAISALENRRAKTQALKQGMMQELLTGRVRLTIDSASQ